MHHLVAAAHGLELTPIYSIVHDCCQPNWAGRTDKNSDLQVVTAVRFFPIVEPVNELLETGERERAELTRLRDQAITADMRAWSVTERKTQSLPDDLSWHDNLAGQIGLDRQFQLRDPESKSRLTKNGVQTTFDYDLETLRGVARLHARRGAKFQIVNLSTACLTFSMPFRAKISSRTVSPFFYTGLATRYESQRLTEDDRDGLPDWINPLRPKSFNNWLSEREWIPIMLETADQPRKLLLKLDVDETNIDSLELASCEEIFAERERQYQESYRHIPSLDELCSLYGDPTNRKIYMMSRDVEGDGWTCTNVPPAPSLPSIDLQHLAS